MSDSANKLTKKKMVIKEVVAPTIMDAVKHLDELQRSWYDMYVISVTAADEREGYVCVKLVSWLNEDSREYYLC